MRDWRERTAVFNRHWLWDREPVFHLRAPFSLEADVWIDKTRCGLVLYKQVKGEYSPEVDCSMSMRREHAEKFARPCKRCVPQ